MLLVAPLGNTPFEAYNPLNDDRTPRGIAFEGFYEWIVYSKAYAENEWKNAEQWNTPTSTILKPGESRSYALQFILSGTAKDTESKLIENKRPVAMSVPGYVLPKDVEGKLFINYPKKIKTIQVQPENDYLESRKAVLTNSDCTIILAAPKESTRDYFYKNTDADEMIFIHRGTGKLRTMLGNPWPTNNVNTLFA